ncbi:hypothetical protein SDC9_107934 [bioreactor metagenome]|uniref:Uncharacterized protein n=1 Tax=bioreactor metagenome TaxID=1076179 RepID=A0A645B6M4_9ZZZZ
MTFQKVLDFQKDNGAVHKAYFLTHTSNRELPECGDSARPQNQILFCQQNACEDLLLFGQKASPAQQYSQRSRIYQNQIAKLEGELPNNGFSKSPNLGRFPTTSQNDHA